MLFLVVICYAPLVCPKLVTFSNKKKLTPMCALSHDQGRNRSAHPSPTSPSGWGSLRSDKGFFQPKIHSFPSLKLILLHCYYYLVFTYACLRCVHNPNMRMKNINGTFYNPSRNLLITSDNSYMRNVSRYF